MRSREGWGWGISLFKPSYEIEDSHVLKGQRKNIIHLGKRNRLIINLVILGPVSRRNRNAVITYMGDKDKKWECIGLLWRSFFWFENIAGNNLSWEKLPMRNTCYEKLLKAKFGHWPSRYSLIKLQAPHQKRQLLKEGSLQQAKTFYLFTITWVREKTQVCNKSLVHGLRGCTIIMIDYKSHTKMLPLF